MASICGYRRSLWHRRFEPFGPRETRLARVSFAEFHQQATVPVRADSGPSPSAMAAYSIGICFNHGFRREMHRAAMGRAGSKGRGPANFSIAQTEAGKNQCLSRKSPAAILRWRRQRVRQSVGRLSAFVKSADAYQGNMERAMSSRYQALGALREATANKGAIASE
jgi:hypothetical protein